ncbi:hypothetical protein L1887_20783 [Cichorium endivia]|nr:hypothetical protein L1887_20783 [Cichorium endivia]
MPVPIINISQDLRNLFHQQQQLRFRFVLQNLPGDSQTSPDYQNSQAAIHSPSSIPATAYTSESASATADAGNSLSATANRQLPLRHSKPFRSTELPQKAFSSIRRRSHETQQMRQGMMRRVSPSQLSNHHMKT